MRLIPKGRKVFFFEKKKQKTFAPRVRRAAPNGQMGAARK
jgi:hypothetical protein